MPLEKWQQYKRWLLYLIWTHIHISNYISTRVNNWQRKFLLLVSIAEFSIFYLPPPLHLKFAILFNSSKNYVVSLPYRCRKFTRIISLLRDLYSVLDLNSFSLPTLDIVTKKKYNKSRYIHWLVNGLYLHNFINSISK